MSGLGLTRVGPLGATARGRDEGHVIMGFPYEGICTALVRNQGAKRERERNRSQAVTQMTEVLGQRRALGRR